MSTIQHPRVRGNLPTDKDYEFCEHHNLQTVEAQQRDPARLDRADAERNKNSWFKSSSSFTSY